jgi:hypothetical protein
LQYWLGHFAPRQKLEPKYSFQKKNYKNLKIGVLALGARYKVKFPHFEVKLQFFYTHIHLFEEKQIYDPV